jgi:hypothetical protein
MLPKISFITQGLLGNSIHAKPDSGDVWYQVTEVSIALLRQPPWVTNDETDIREPRRAMKSHHDVSHMIPNQSRQIDIETNSWILHPVKNTLDDIPPGAVNEKSMFARGAQNCLSK